MKTFARIDVLICLLLMLAVALLPGCSNLTPNQRLHAGEVAYVAADLGLTAADAAGKIPSSAKPLIQVDLNDFLDRLNDAQAWVDANPALADTPGLSPPSLDALDIIRARVRKYVLQYSLFAPLPAFRQLPPPVTPATTQPN